MVAMTVVIFSVMWVWFRTKNKRRDNGEDDHTVTGMTEEEILELGEHNPSFRYTY
jgi:hypothetical protein